MFLLLLILYMFGDLSLFVVFTCSHMQFSTEVVLFTRKNFTSCALFILGCGFCKDTITCNVINGSCSDGCADGWFGEKCDISKCSRYVDISKHLLLLRYYKHICDMIPGVGVLIPALMCMLTIENFKLFLDNYHYISFRIWY